MAKKVLSLALACLLAHLFTSVKPASASPNQSPSKDDQQAEKIKRKVQDLGVSARVTVILKNGQERYGSVAAIGDDSFQILEVDQKQLMTISYKDAKKVRYNYGGPNPFNGKRWNPKWGVIMSAALIGFILIIVPLSIPKT
jgi:hypothetical protein